MKLNKLIKTLLLSIVVLMGNVSYVDAHKDTSVESHKDGMFFTGETHYHHGYEAHSHQSNGHCKYREADAISFGESHGYNDAYNFGKVEPNYRYNPEEYNNSTLYEEIYISSYDTGFTEGATKLEREKESAYNDGKNLGTQGGGYVNKYKENEYIEAEYKKGYEEGYEIFKAEQIKKYEAQGKEAGLTTGPKPELYDLEPEYKQAYDEGYEKGKSERKNKIVEEGTKAAFGNGKSKDSYTDSEERSWYEEGFNIGVEDKDKLIDTAFEKGYKGGNKTVPDEFKHLENMFEEYYEKGVAKKAEENRNILIVGSIVLIAIVGIVIYVRKRSLAKRANVKENEYNQAS